jgi:hypothetical protein
VAIKTLQFDKDTKTQDTDVDFDVERKMFRDEIKSLERERTRLEQLCRNAKVDTHTRKEKDLEKATNKACDASRRGRQDEAQKSDTRSDAESVENDTDLTTHVGP